MLIKNRKTIVNFEKGILKIRNVTLGMERAIKTNNSKNKKLSALVIYDKDDK